MTTDLVQFLRARLDEDNEAARKAAALCGCHPAAPSWTFRDGDDEEDGRIITVGDPHPILLGKRRRLAQRWNQSYDGLFAAQHIVRHDPARVLAEVDAKRRILLLHNIPAVVSPKMAAFGLRKGESPEDDRRCAGCGLDSMDDPITPDVSECPILRALALPYADHPDYREEWKP
ncbi:DUF6221 family protein [Streptomyces sp. NPDC099050]|uniref:DUF6221 family protein n=1 Tax=Streptomyces sp. NPDC099050 TaxID=3366100 RepID=UPI00380D89D7